MINKITPEKLKDPHINDDVDHLTDSLAHAMYYWRTVVGTRLRKHLHDEQHDSYACECKRCNLTHYTSDKRLNCEYCGSSDPEVFTCTELKE